MHVSLVIRLLLVVIIFSLSSNDVTSGYNILVLPLPLKSHVFSMSGIVRGLTARGHHVSLFVGNHFPLDSTDTTSGEARLLSVERYVDTKDGVTTDYEELFENVTMQILESNVQSGQMKPHIVDVSDTVCRQWTTDNEALLTRLENEHFDLAVVDGLFFMKCIYLVPHRLHLPIITYCDIVDPFLVRTPWLPSIVPHPLLPLTDDMTLLERLKNTLIYAAFPWIFPDPPADIISEYQRYGAFGKMDDIIRTSKLWLLSKDPVLDYARPMMPNMVYVGGLTLGRSPGELPAEMKSFVKGAQKGIILISFGSMASRFPVKIAKKFLGAFRQLEGYRFIWRLNNKDKLEIPDNVMISHWLPQREILAHPNTKLFITHGGNNGQFEAMYYGVPMIGFPILGDQHHSALRLERKGYGIAMDIHSFTSEELLQNIEVILAEPSYKVRVQNASEIFRSQPQSPEERAAFWIEHVCRFSGEHLKSASTEMSVHSYLLLDVAGLILLIAALLVFVLAKLVRVLLRKFEVKRMKLD